MIRNIINRYVEKDRTPFWISSNRTNVVCEIYSQEEILNEVS